jgi:Uncharacterised protein family (UPF0175)
MLALAIMEVTLQIPDDLAHRLTAAGSDLSRLAQEAFALEEFKSGHITKSELRRMLGFATGHQLNEFLKAHDVNLGTGREFAALQALRVSS